MSDKDKTKEFSIIEVFENYIKNNDDSKIKNIPKCCCDC